jgi:probable HAF family extracellular repeat protein
MTDLGGLPATPNSEAQFINSSKQIVGESFTCDFSAPVAFLWENGSIVDLNTLISGNSQIFLYWSTFSDSGEIAVYGSLANGDTRAFLLIPCDDNHPGVEGCDYGMVGAPAAVPQTSSAVRDASSHSLPQSLMRRMGEHRIPGLGAPRPE